MAKSAAEERRERNAAVAVLQHQISGLTKTVDELQANRDARAAALVDLRADLRVEAAAWRADHLALAREFAEFKRRAEVREQRWRAWR